MLTDVKVCESCVMVALKERYLNTLIQATNRLRADRVLRIFDLLISKISMEKCGHHHHQFIIVFWANTVTHLMAISEKSACWNGSFSKPSRILGICICR